MPVEAEDAAESLEPVRVGEPAQDLFRPEFADHKEDDLARQADHPLEEPSRRLTAVEWEMRVAGAGHLECGGSPPLYDALSEQRSHSAPSRSDHGRAVR